MKQKLQKRFLLIATPVVFGVVIAGSATIISCATTTVNPLIAQEIARLSQIQWDLHPIKAQQVKLINQNNFYQLIKNWNLVQKKGFEYQIDRWNLDEQTKTMSWIFKVKEIITQQSSQTNLISVNLILDQPPNQVQPPQFDPNLGLGWAKITNQNPASANQYDINHADQYHFNRPYYENDLVTLKQNGSAANNKPSPGIPSNSTTYAKEDWISTKEQAQLAKQVFAISFVEDGGVEKTGTAWILDYQLPEDNSYPLTWYFGTNAHVIDDLRVANDQLYPEKFAKWDPTNQRYRAQNTRRISFAKLLNPQANTPYKDSNGGGWEINDLNLIDPTKEDLNWQKQEGFYLENPPVKTIFQGFDFLSTSPNQFSAVNPWKDKEEYADFGVFEITFRDENQARAITNNYANWDESLKFKYRKNTDFINDPELAPKLIHELGYPSDNNIKHVATNTNAISFAQGNTNQNNGLTKSPNYATWTHVNGIFDAHIAMSDFGYAYEWMDNSVSDLDQVRKTTPYVGYGLIYGTEAGNMRGGSSGALSIDQDGYAIGIHYASDNNSAMGGTQAFVSKGYDYQGYYGNYNLPEYDLIAGGGQYQKASYFQNMQKLYGKTNVKTRLFPQGFK